MNIRQIAVNFNPVSDADLKALIDTHTRDKIIAALQALSLPLEPLSKRSQQERRALRDYLEPPLVFEPEPKKSNDIHTTSAHPDTFKRTSELPTGSKSALHSAALDYAGDGRKIFPCHPGTKQPATPNGYKDATDDLGQVDAWWTANPDYNIGLWPEPSGLAVIDADLYKEGAQASLDALKMPATFEVTSARGGTHFYLKGSLPQSNGTPGRRGTLGDYIDVRGQTGYVLLPPSMFEGKQYTVKAERPFAPVPQEYVERLAKPDAEAKPIPGVVIDLPANGKRAEDWLRDRVKRGDVATAGERGDDATFVVAAYLVRNLALSPATALDILERIYNPSCVPPWPRADLVRIITSARANGLAAIGRDAFIEEPKSAKEAFKDFDFSKAKTEEPKADTQTLGYQIASKTKTEKIVWLWPERIPANELSIVGGDPDCGKSTLVYDLIAKITRGGSMPNEEGRVPQGAALVLTAEDSVKSVLVPRLKAAGADLDQVIILDAMVKVEGGKRLLDLAVDLDRIKATIAYLATQNIIVRLVTIDPITAYLGAGVNSFKAADMRRLLTPIREWADENKITVLIVTHLNKSGTSANPLNRLTDSHALGALSRSAWLCAPERDDDGNESGRFLFMRAKGNLAKRDVKNLAYRLEGVDVALDDDSTYNHPRIAWDSIVETTAREAFDPDYTKPRTKQDTAAMFLKAALADGPVPVAKIREMADERDLGWRTIERAKAKLSVISEPVGFGPGSQHVWRLRDIAQEIVAAEAARGARALGIDPQDPDYALLCPSETRH